MRLQLQLPILFILSICINNLTAQAPVTDADLLRGNRLWIEGHYDSAFVFYQKSKATAIEQNDDELLCYALSFTGKYWGRMDKIDQAKQALDSAISLRDSLHPAVLLAIRERTNLRVMQGEFDEGIADLKRMLPSVESLPLRLDSLKAMIYNSLGNFHLYIEDLEGGLKYCTKALEIRKRILPENHPYIAFGENAIATVQTWEGDYEKALPHFQKAVAIFESNFGPSHPQALMVKTNIAIIHTDIGQSRRALQIYKECLPYLEKMQPRARIITLLNLGSTYMTLGDFEEALNTFSIAEAWVNKKPGLNVEARSYIESERSLIYFGMGEHEKALVHINNAMEEKVRVFGKDAEQLGMGYLRQGVILSNMDRFEKAEQAFKNAISFLKRYAPPKDVNLGHTHEYYGEMLINSGNPAKARDQLQLALEAYGLTEVTWNNADVYAYIADSWTVESIFDSAFIALKRAMHEVDPQYPFTMHPDASILQFWQSPPLKNVLESMGDANQGLYEQTNDVKHLKAALACFEHLISVSDSQRHYYEVAAYREISAKKLFKEFNVTLNLCLDAYKKTGEKEFIERAFLIAEKSKAANLRDHIQSMQALTYAGIPQEYIERERSYRQQLAELSDPDAQEDNFNAKSALNLEYRGFLEGLEQNYPRYFRLKYADDALSIEEIYSKLNPEEALYSYFWGENNLYIFCLFNHTIQSHFIPLHNSDFTDQLDQWNEFLTTPGADGSKVEQAGKVLHSLQELLLPNFSNNISSLVLIPDGRLGYLPFETLLTDEPTNSKMNTWPWLWKDARSSYSYAAELWVQDRSKNGSTRSASYLGFAPDFGTENLQKTRIMLGALEHNQDEVLEVAKMMRGTALTGASANEHMLKTLDGKGHVLHFATHAVADDESQLNSRLYLSPGKDSLEDGILHAYELYGLNLPSPLTVLSACQTGRGPLLKGEGIISLARAFQYAGSERVLTTLWHIDDKASADVSKLFFELLASGLSSGEALQAARLNYLQQSDEFHAHPYFWGAFIMIGDQGIISLPSRPALWPYAIGLGLAFFFFLGLRQKIFEMSSSKK